MSMITLQNEVFLLIESLNKWLNTSNSTQSKSTNNQIETAG